MAFPIPSHLPRKSIPQDISSQILSKIDSATTKTLDSALATSWIAELEKSIQATKERIHERVQADLPEFKRQLSSSKSVLSRLQTLAANVDILSDTVSNPGTGMIAALLQNLTSHAQLAQESADARAKHEALSHLLQCRNELQSLKYLLGAGKLEEAVGACQRLHVLFKGLPDHLGRAVVFVDAQTNFRAAEARVEDQLSDAFSRSIVVSPNNLVVFSSVQVRQSETAISLPSILSSMSDNSLSNHLTTLRRDVTTHFIDHILKQPSCITTASSMAEHVLSYIPSPPNEEDRTTRLDNLAVVLTFLSEHLFSFLPSSQRRLFVRSLSRPVATSILNNVLIAFLPSSFDRLPPFLGLVRQAVSFEEQILVGVLENDPNDRPIKTWADGVTGHYERQRRLQILEAARAVIISLENPIDTFLAEIEIPAESNSTAIPVQPENGVQDFVPELEAKDDAWGFDEDTTTNEAEEDGWGFDDDTIPEPDPEEKVPQPEPESQLSKPSPSPDIIDTDDGPDPSEAWGWNDDDDVPLSEETAWDDPWADESSVSVPVDINPPAPAVTSPKAATRLEKAATKSKKHLNGASSMNSPDIPASPPYFRQPSPVVSHVTSALQDRGEPGPIQPAKRPTRLAINVKETYPVTKRMKRILTIVEDVLNEGKQFTSSQLFPEFGSSSTPGSIILQSAPSILELYLGLYPVKFCKELELPERGMNLSNDCLFLSSEIERIHHGIGSSISEGIREKLVECSHHLKTWGDSLYHDAIHQQQSLIEQILAAGTQGFTYTGDQDRYDECENALGQVVRDIRRLAQRLKGALAKSRYYIAIGMVTDAALSRILRDVLALPDIPELESHRLSELCRILNSLEGLFVEDPSQPSFVVAYVPSWLKFSYLSELLEASMADIMFLFEEGALVDFDVEELVRLVRALFADTMLRTTTINKILGDHPVPSQ